MQTFEQKCMNCDMKNPLESFKKLEWNKNESMNWVLVSRNYLVSGTESKMKEKWNDLKRSMDHH